MLQYIDRFRTLKLPDGNILGRRRLETIAPDLWQAPLLGRPILNRRIPLQCNSLRFLGDISRVAPKIPFLPVGIGQLLLTSAIRQCRVTAPRNDLSVPETILVRVTPVLLLFRNEKPLGNAISLVFRCIVKLTSLLVRVRPPPKLGMSATRTVVVWQVSTDLAERAQGRILTPRVRGICQWSRMKRTEKLSI